MFSNTQPFLSFQGWGDLQRGEGAMPVKKLFQGNDGGLKANEKTQQL
jgi:hypothetical protein